MIDMEHVLADTRGSLANAEKRRAALTAELEDCRSALENVRAHQTQPILLGVALRLGCSHFIFYQDIVSGLHV